MQKIQKYYSHQGVSQSSLKDLAYHPMYYKAKYIDKTLPETYGMDSEHFIIGSLSDCILLTPEYFEQMFAICDFSISPQLKKLIDYIVKNKKDYSSYDLLFDMTRALNIFGQIKSIETFKKSLQKENFEEAIVFYEENIGKTIVEQTQYEKALQISNSFAKNVFTKDYFKLSDNVELLTALPIYWFYSGRSLKSLIDFIRINHKNKTITVNDLKTTRFDTASFSSSILEYRYDIQAAFYLEAVRWWIANIRQDLEDYEILGFNFFVESTNHVGNPLIYHMMNDDILIGEEGAYINTNGIVKHFIGFKELLENLNWHYENDIWFCTKNQYKNKGIINVNIARN